MSVPEQPTIIVVHEKERRSKCTVEPLRETEGFEFLSYPLKQPVMMEGYVRLGIGGPLLSPADRTQGLLVLDATWKLADRMEADFCDVPIRSLEPFQTAYPRNSKLYEDPSEGLATIEAIFAAYLQLGYPVDGLLDAYYWKETFLERNADLIEQIRGRIQR